MERHLRSRIDPHPFTVWRRLGAIDGASFTDIQSVYAVSLSSCNSEIENATFDQIDGYSLYVSGGDHDISDVTMTSVNEVYSFYDAMRFSASEAMNVSITDTTISDGLGGGIYTYSSDSTTYPLNLNISGVEMNNMANDALETNGTTVYLEDYTIDGTRYGINSTNSTLT